MVRASAVFPTSRRRRSALLLALATALSATVLTTAPAVGSSRPWSVRPGPAGSCEALRSALAPGADEAAPFGGETVIAAGLPAAGAPDRAALDAALRSIPRRDLSHYERVGGAVSASAPSEVRARYWRAAIAADEVYRWGSLLCDLDDIPGVTAFNEVVRAAVGEFTNGRWPAELGQRLAARFPERFASDQVRVLVEPGGGALTVTATGPLSFCARFSASEGLIPTVYAGETPRAACVAVDRFSPQD